jgi:hypothetical protein
MRTLTMLLLLVELSLGSAQTVTPKQPTAPAPDSHKPLLTELRGKLARRREYDVGFIRNVSRVLNILNSEGRDRAQAYCMATVSNAKQSLESPPDTEYALLSDGAVLRTPGKPPLTLEEAFHISERMRLGNPFIEDSALVNDCMGSFLWFGTWHNRPMTSDETLRNVLAKVKADLDELEKTIDPRILDAARKTEATPICPTLMTEWNRSGTLCYTDSSWKLFR